MTVKRKDCYISLYLKLISKKNVVKRFGSLINGKLAEIPKKTHTDVCNLTQKKQGKRSTVHWKEGWTNGQIGGKGSIVKWLQNQTPIYAVYKRTTSSQSTLTA